MMVEDRVIATAIVLQRAILLVHEGGKYAIKRYGQELEGGIGFWEDTLDEAWTRFIGVQQSALKQQKSYLAPEERRWVRQIEDIPPLAED